MRNQYDRKYIIIHEPIRDKHRRRVFERKLAEAESKGYRLVGHPTFQSVYEGANRVLVFGTALMHRKGTKV